TYYPPPTLPNPKANQRTSNSRNNRRNRHDNSIYGILQDDEYYKERGDFWTPISEPSIRRHIENDAGTI
ncbi:34094_t:CDS:2, partial [Gigaspora margarita]